MSKKLSILAMSLLLIVSLSACGKKDKILSEDSKKDQYNTLTDWLKSGKGVKCDVETAEGKITIKTKDGKVRMDGVPWMNMENLGEEVSEGSSISDGDWMYMWSGQKGIKMNLKEMSEIGAEDDNEFDEEDYSWEDWSADQDEMGTSYKCEESKISNDEFTPPADVEFTDWGEMIKGFQNLGNNLPSVEGSQGMSQEELEAQLEKMMQDAGVN